MDEIGMGMLVGMASADEDERVEQYEKDVANLRQELSNRLAGVVYQTAFKEAAAAVHEQMIEELRLAARLRAIRALPQGQAFSSEQTRDLASSKEILASAHGSLCASGNVDGRNRAYAEYAAVAVARISGGRMKMSSAEIENARLARAIK